MARFLVTLVLVAVAVAVAAEARAGGKGPQKDIVIQGALALNDPKDTKRNTPCKIHVVPLKKGQSYTIEMFGFGFDAFLRLEDKAGRELAQDDDSGGNLNARIIFDCPKDDEYRIICTCFANAAGQYRLTVRSAGAVKVAAGHALLIGKAAPDFEAGFALNGKAGRLSDLKGKVVVLTFWEVRSAGSVAALAQLRDWSKQHKDGGLEVVGVTYFPSEMGQKLGFDADAGKLKNIREASSATDQALFKAFAAHHKLEHLLLTLHEGQALKAFNDYVVNGLPQVVLIDRKGVVRSIYSGAVQVRSAEVGAEIKKLLADS
jgi:peroxiredoxin